MKTTPFWHEAAPPEPPSESVAPQDIDIAIVGAGFTGLSAALVLAEAGREVAVFDMGAPGAGASTRNGGMLGWGHRASIAGLARRYGETGALAILREARASLEFTTALLDRLPCDAMYRQSGRFLGAGSPRHFNALSQWARTEAPRLDMAVEIVPRGDQHRYVASDLYHGGLFFPQHGGLHPGLFHRGLLMAARSAGARIIDRCAIEGAHGHDGAWTLRHARGETRCKTLVYTGNGYTGGRHSPFPMLARHLIPIPSYIIATQPLGLTRMQSLFPKGSMIVETRAQHSYFRPDPGGERLLYGGRASLNLIDEKRAAARLRDMMLSVFPDLDGVKISHSWRGFVAFTFDGVPHIGQKDGVWFACGYNGSGVAMAPYLGWRLGQRIIGSDQGQTGLDIALFKPQPFYGGNPWFLHFVEAWMKIKDRIEGVQAVRRRD